MEGNSDDIRLTAILLKQQLSFVLPVFFLLLPLLLWLPILQDRVVWTVVYTLFLLFISVLDFRYGYIFDRSLVFLAGFAVLEGICLPWLFPGFLSCLAGALLGGGLLLFLRIATRGGMGGGDVKFSAVAGFALGWQGVIFMLAVAFISGGLVAALLLLLHRCHKGDMIPFGPFLALGAWAAYIILPLLLIENEVFYG